MEQEGAFSARQRKIADDRLTEQNKADMTIESYTDEERFEFVTELCQPKNLLFIKLKLIEELNELSTRLTQSLTKPTDIMNTHIFAEMIDVMFWITALKDVSKFNEKQMHHAMDHKCSKLIEYSKTYKDWGKIQC